MRRGRNPALLPLAQKRMPAAMRRGRNPVLLPLAQKRMPAAMRRGRNPALLPLAQKRMPAAMRRGRNPALLPLAQKRMPAAMRRGRIPAPSGAVDTSEADGPIAAAPSPLSPLPCPACLPDSPGMEGEIALLRSLTNRLLSKRPIDHVQISRYLRILARSLPANSRMPRELTDEEQIDALIKKVFHKTVDEGEMTFFDLLPVRMAQPGDKWWPWRHLVPLQHRQGFGLIGPQDPRPPGDAEYFANLNACEEAESHYLEDAFDEDPPDDLDIFTDDPGPLPDPDDEYPNDEEYPPPDGEAPPTSTIIPEKSEIYPLLDTPPDEEPHRDGLTVIPAEVVGVADVEDAHGRAPWRAGIHPREESRLSSKTPQPENPPQQDAPSRESIPHDGLAPGSPTPRRTARGRPRPP